MRQPAFPDGIHPSDRSTSLQVHRDSHESRTSAFQRHFQHLSILLLFLLGSAIGLLAQEKPTGGIRGTVLDKELNAPLVGVQVVVVGTKVGVLTSAEGNFLISQVPVGTYSLAFAKAGYERQLITSVVVNAGRLTELKVEMGIEVVEMEELVVSGGEVEPAEETGLLDLRAEAVSFQDAISSDLISKAGAGDVAGALKFVVGTSIVEGKYATVRGLSDRYTGTTLNGVRVPSADPRRRAVQVDLFPTGTVESLAVTKTFTPDLQGDFTGGGVDIRTKSVPDKLTFSVSMAAESNSLATHNEDYLTYEGGGVPFGGPDAQDRAMSEEAKQPICTSTLTTNCIPTPPTPRLIPRAGEMERAQTLDQLVRSFAPAMGVSQDTPGYNSGFAFVGGNRWEVGSGVTLGLLGALNYVHKYDFYGNGINSSKFISNPGDPLNGPTRDDSQGAEESLTGVLINFEVRAGENQRYGLNLIGNQAAEDQARFQFQNLGGGSQQQNQSLHYTQRLVTSIQLHGEQHFPSVKDLSLDWFYALNSTRQEEPDVRFFRNNFSFITLEGTIPTGTTEPERTRRIWRDVEEDNYQAAANVRKSFPTWGDLPAMFQGGFRLDRTDRTYDQRSFTYYFQTQVGTGPDVAENAEKAKFHATSPDQLWTDVFTDPEFIGLAPNIVISTPQRYPAPDQLLWYIQNLATDVDYTGDQKIDAVYGMVEFPFLPNLRVVAGVRFETTDISVVPVNPRTGKVEVIVTNPSSGDRGIESVPEAEATADIQEGSLLPSVGVIWSIRQGMALRATASATLARPTFRELAPVATEEFIFGDEYVGNIDLTISKITNYDLRWEWFPQSGIVVSASGFYKQIRDPIQTITFGVANRSFIQPVNYPSGKVAGLELEARTNFAWAHESLRGLSFGFNYAAIQSEADLPESEQQALAPYDLDEPTVRLFGQPDKIWNVNLTFDWERSGTSAGVFYNFSGESLVTAAAKGLENATPNVYLEPIKTLDVTFSQRLGKGFTLAFRAKNLQPQSVESIYRTPAGQEAVKTERESARLLGVALSWSW